MPAPAGRGSRRRDSLGVGKRRPGFDIDLIHEVLHDIPDARIAIGATAPGIEGFRRSHRDALTTARMIIRLESPHRVAFFTDVEMVALLTENAEGADDFIQRTLGNLESASPALKTTLLTFINQQCNASGRETSLHPPQHLDEPTRDRATTSAPPSRRHHHSRRRRTRSPAVAGEANQRSSGKERVEWHQDALARQRSTDRYATAAARPSRPSCEPPGPDGRARRRPAGNVRRPPR